MAAVSPQLSTPSHGSPLPGRGEGALPLSPCESQEPQEQHRQRLRVWGKVEGGQPTPTAVPCHTAKGLLAAGTKMLI